MGTNNVTKPLVSLDILQYYDEQIKNWVARRIQNKTSISFIEGDNFPTTGTEDILYVTKNGLFLWDTTNNDYIPISSSDTAPEWGIF